MIERKLGLGLRPSLGSLEPSTGHMGHREGMTDSMPDGLRSYFNQFGDIDNCTIMRDPTGRSRGFAFLTFKNVSSVEAVLAKDHQLDGKMVSFGAS